MSLKGVFPWNDYEDILKRAMPHIKKGLKEYLKNQEDLSHGLFLGNFDALDQGANTSSINYDEPNAIFQHKLRRNLGLFAARKTLSQQEALSKFILDEKGKLRSFVEFQKKASSVIKDYNRNWLAAEYNTTVRSARMAEQWETALQEAELYPNLEYLPSRSAEPREEHKQYYHIIRPINDPFWDEHFPPNGWQCLCGFKTTDKKQTDIPKGLPKPAVGFRQNVGKSARPFDKDHPYYATRFPNAEQMSSEFMESNPFYSKLDSGVQVSLWSHASDFSQNLKYAEMIGRQLDKKVKIRPHLPIGKNPELLIDSVVADVTVSQAETFKKAIKNAFKGKSKQMRGFDNYIVVLGAQLYKNESTESIARHLYGELNSHKRCQALILEWNGLSVLERGLTYIQILEALKKSKGNQ